MTIKKSFWHEKFFIGPYQFPRFVGGPVDGVTDSPYRKLIRKFSKEELLYTEIRHVCAVAHDKGVARSLDFDPIERPLNFQLTAHDETCIERACERVIEAGIEIVDLNIGCPARNIVKSGAGSSLMSDLTQLEKVLVAFRKVLTIPFTVKMRAGFKEKNALDVATLIENCGADALAIHPRLQSEKFCGELDFKLVENLKNKLSIPIIFSGGIEDWSSAADTYEKTGADAFMVSRGLWGAPWKLQELEAQSHGKAYLITSKIIGSSMLEHLDNLLVYYGDHGLFCFRKYIPYYFKGIPNVLELKKRLIISTQITEIKDEIATFFGV